MPTERLQKILASAGVASRRHAEELIREGRVTVNGARVTELGSKADPEKDHVKVDGKLVRRPAVRQYLLLNKPRGYVATKEGPEARHTVFELIRGRKAPGLVPVGRLDVESEGLLILTDDGALVHKLTHPSGGCRKEYEVKVAGVPTDAQLARLRRGITLPPEPRGTDENGRERFAPAERTTSAEIEILETTPERDGAGGNTWLKVVLGEGRSRQIRRMFQVIGHPVSKLRRTAIGPVRDRELPKGEYRELDEREVRALQALRAGPVAEPVKRARSRAPRTPRRRP